MRFFLFFVAVFFWSNQAFAEKGCCSTHGGVCNCACCDGTVLSQACLKHYDQCSPKQEEVKAGAKSKLLPAVKSEKKS